MLFIVVDIKNDWKIWNNKDYDALIKLDPKNDSAFNRGLAKSRLGKQEEAINDYDEAIKLDPKYWLAFFNR